MSSSEPGFFEVVGTQRACRRFSDEPVPDGDLRRMLDAAVHAPSAENAQPWVFVIVRDDEQRRALGALNQRLWVEGGRHHAVARVDPRLVAEIDEAAAAGFGGAPVLVVVAADTRAGLPRRVLDSSIFPAVQNLLLAATALGYGSALTILATLAADELRAIVGLPDGVEPRAVVPVGRPATSLAPPRRQPAASKAHLDRYGTPLGRD